MPSVGSIGWQLIFAEQERTSPANKLVQSVTSAETKQKISDRAPSEVDDDDGRMEWNASGIVGMVKTGRNREPRKG